MFSWFSFLTYAVVTAVTPGPNTLMSMSNGGRLGFRRALPFNFGIWAGFTVASLSFTCPARHASAAAERVLNRRTDQTQASILVVVLTGASPLVLVVDDLLDLPGVHPGDDEGDQGDNEEELHEETENHPGDHHATGDLQGAGVLAHVLLALGDGTAGVLVD